MSLIIDTIRYWEIISYFRPQPPTDTKFTVAKFSQVKPQV